MKLLKGEWWENTKIGLPLFQNVLGKSGTSDNIYIIDALIKKQIVGTTDVIGIEGFSSSFNSKTRLYSFSCTVNTRYGAIQFTENF